MSSGYPYPQDPYNPYMPYPREPSVASVFIKVMIYYVIFVFIVMLVVYLLAKIANPKCTQNFGSMVRVGDHTGIMNRPDIIDSELNRQQKYDSDDRTADEYYDDRVYKHTGHNAASKHPRDQKHPGTGTLYRKYIEKSAN